MRVLHITTNYPTPDYPIFGIFVKEQVESLRARGVDCDVIYCDRKGRGTWMYLSYIPKVWWRILRGRYDIIHCHHVLSALICLCTLWPLFKKCVVSYQNDPVREWKLNCFSLIHLCFNRIIIKNTSPYLSKSRTVYLPNGCNAGFFEPKDRIACRKELGLDSDAVYILYMDSNKWGRTQKRKDRFDAVLEILRRDGADVRALELYNTPRELIPTCMNACNLHLISSDFEGSPNSVKECMCCNVPVVSTDVGNVRDMIGDIPGCYVVEDFSPEALARAVGMVLNASEPFRGREAFLKKGYTLSGVALKLKSLYEEIL